MFALTNVEWFGIVELSLLAMGLGGSVVCKLILSRFDRLETKISNNTRQLHDEIRDFKTANNEAHQEAFERIAAVEAILGERKNS